MALRGFGSRGLVAALVCGTALVCGAAAPASAQGTWVQLSSMPAAAFGTTAATGGGKVWVVGGANGSTELKTAYSYDPAATTKWAQLPSMTFCRFGAGAAFTSGALYVIGGVGTSSVSDPPQPDDCPPGNPPPIEGAPGEPCPTGDVLCSVERYDPANNSWSQVGHMHDSRYGVAVAQTGGLIYAIGGSDGTGVLTSVESYDPDTDTWTTRAPLHVARMWASAAVGGDGHIYVIGGENNGGQLATVEAYNPSTDTWSTTVDSLPMPVAHGAAVASPDGRVLLVGGSDDNGNLLDSVYAYAPSSDSWTQISSLPNGPRAYEAAAPMPSVPGQSILVSGMGNSGLLTSTWRFDLIDTTKPVINAVTIDNGAAWTGSNDVTVHVTATDSGGVASVAISNRAPFNGALVPAATSTFAYQAGGVDIPWDLSFARLSNVNPLKIYVQVTDGAGNLSGINQQASISLDSVDPTMVSGPGTRLVAGVALGGTSAPVQAYWQGSDNIGVTRYTLQRTIDGGATYQPLTLSPANAVSSNRTVSRACSCGYRVQASDAAGNTTAWATGALFVPSVVQEGATGTSHTGIWATGTSSNYDAGHDRYASKAGASFSYSFTARSVAWVAPKSATRGQAKVYVDGHLSGTVSLYSSTAKNRQLIFAKNWSEVGHHTLRIVVVGTRGHPRVDVDAFERLI